MKLLREQAFTTVDGLTGRALLVQNFTENSYQSWFAEVVWIAHEGRLFRCGAFAMNNRHVDILTWARTFRIMTHGMRESLRVKRLRVVTTRAGETIEQLSERTDNTWDPT